MQHYETVIIGAGVSGIFAAMKLAQHHRRILIIDSGCSFAERQLLLGQSIASHPTSARYFGFGGLGLSEGKYNYTNDFGGDLAAKIGAKQSLLYQNQVDELLYDYGAHTKPRYSTLNTDLAQRATELGFHLLSTETRHLGTALSTALFKRFAEYLQSRIELSFNTQVATMHLQRNRWRLSLTNHQTLSAGQVIVAVGRSGINWFEPIARQLGLEYHPTRLDLGFRIEMHNQQLRSLLKTTFETKLHYQTRHYSATTYCMNPNGRVIAKYQDGMAMPDGQNCHERGQSANLNFTLFMPHWFADRSVADGYLKQTITNINQGRAMIAAQRLADIDRRFSYRDHTIAATLTNAHFTDLAPLTPPDYLAYTCDFLLALQQLLGERIDGNTILYALDSKTYAPVYKTDVHFLTQAANLYLIGDCSGVSCSLTQAAASGLYVADQLA